MRVGFIHSAALAHAPFGDDYRGDDIDDDREDRDQGQAVIISDAERDGGEHQPHEGRPYIEGEEANQIVDGTGTALDDPIECAGPPSLVKVQRKRLRMPESVHAGDALCVLTDGRKQPVAHLRHGRSKKADTNPDREPICGRAEGRRLATFRNSAVDRVSQQQGRNHFQHRSSECDQDCDHHDWPPFRQFRPREQLQDSQNGGADPAISAFDLVMVSGGSVRIRHRPHMGTK